ncbi:Ig-like domain-containing protein [Eubacterium sp. MSJ-13]|uniref:NlpC/P60 family protein n=1 Tax=Eubacterium sp. MSJ-13 TaxID=2841513 RepID=UPI001C103765|nr:NlpC/P60 family protein [Eubacterium sp. MSJ-13]MBU5479257.1 Ig-like domain-containing protein [Eubacterium sp. MSJ-13]
MKNRRNIKNRIMAAGLAVAMCLTMLSSMAFTDNVSAATHISGVKKTVSSVNVAAGQSDEKNIVFDAQNEDGEYTVSVNDKGLFSIVNYENFDNAIESVKWSTSDEDIVRVTDSENFTASYEAVSSGRINIYADVTYNRNSGEYSGYISDDDDDYDSDGFYDDDSTYWDRYTFSLCVYPDMSGVELESTSQTRYITSYDYNTQFDFQLKSDIFLDESNSDIGFDVVKNSNSAMDISASLNNNVVSIWAYNTGQTNVTFKIYGKEFEVSIKIVSIDMNKTSLLIVKGKSAKIKVKGVSKGIKWTSTKKSVVKVSGNGNIKSKKIGNAVVIANVNGTKIGCAVSVVSPKIYNVIKRARSIGKGKYSQSKRMEKGYYDCSSLVWRSYSKYGVYFGAKSYAPVAADLCKWCWTKGKRVSSGLKDSQVQNMKLNAGDLIFKQGVNNGRFKGVYHVEMFAGYSCAGIASNGKPILNATWANRTDGYYAEGSIVARP